MDNNSILRTEENGIEYFTVVATGESGMSQRGLAKACGKSLSTIQNLIKNLTDGSVPKGLESLLGKTIHLTYEQIKFVKKGKIAKVFNAFFCSAVIKHYAYLGSEQAQSVDRTTGEIGINSFIQGKTGWLPNQYQSSHQARKDISRILAKPNPWEKLYEKEMCDKIRKWFGFDCPKFYWWYAYDWMSCEERDRLDSANPISASISKSGKKRIARKSKIHQHIDVQTRLRLTVYVEHLWRCIEYSDTRTEFEKKWSRKYGAPEQLELFDLWDFVA